MSASKTNLLLVNNSAPMARSTRGTATELYRRAKTEKLVFHAFGGRIWAENVNRWFSEPIVIAIFVTVVDDLYGIPRHLVKRSNRSTHLKMKALRYVTRHKKMGYYKGLDV
jgi:hypothetical protein